jgi:peptide/nickel transport system permease protein
MLRYIGRRCALALIVVFGVLAITFFVSRVVPADPAILFAGGDRATSASVLEARKELGLDKPLPEQFIAYVGKVATGDFGRSYLTRRPVAQDLAAFFPATLELVLPAMFLSLLVGIPIGVLAGRADGGKLDRVVRFLAISGAAIPPFWAALIAQLVFASTLRLLPVAGRIGSDVAVLHPITTTTGFYLVDAALQGNWTAWTDALRHMVIPVAVLAIQPCSLVIRQTRESVATVRRELYVTAAQAAGLPERFILFRYVLKNAISPTLTSVSLIFAAAFTGTVLVEVIFAWPGIGRYLTDAILSADFPSLLAVTIVATLAYVVINLVVDVLQAFIDPRIALT